LPVRITRRGDIPVSWPVSLSTAVAGALPEGVVTWMSRNCGAACEFAPMRGSRLSGLRAGLSPSSVIFLETAALQPGRSEIDGGST